MGRTLLVIIVLAAACGALAWWWMGRAHEAQAWQGYADADFVLVAPTLAGQLTALRVARGEEVAAGAPLFDQDDGQEQAQLNQAQHQLDQAALTLANLEAPGRPTEIRQAEANLADAIASRDRLRKDAERLQGLLESGSVSVQSRDQAEADYRSAAAHVDALEAARAQSREATGRLDEIKAQQAAVEAARAAVAEARWRERQRHLAAPAAGVVADTLARSGETVAAGSPVVSLLPPGNRYLRFFVPETELSRVHVGDHVAVAWDGAPAGAQATIDFISPQSEYTPPVIYSDENRAKLVFLVEARPEPSYARALNPGQPVQVRAAAAARVAAP